MNRFMQYFDSHLTSTISTTSLLILIVIAGATNLQAAEKGTRDAVVERINTTAPWIVKVDVNHRDHVYTFGDTLQASVTSEHSGYLYLLYRNAKGQVKALFPNSLDQENKIGAKERFTVPGPRAPFRIRIAEPGGRETLKAIVTQRPLPAAAVASLLAGGSDRVNKDAFIEAIDDLESNRWAEHCVEILTVSQKQERRPRRVGVFIGLNKFKDNKIPALHVCRQDAEQMAKVMKAHGQLDQVILLVDEAATRDNIQKAICTTAARETRPGDTVIIFWSGHGGRCADDNQDEKDGFDEYLVPYDGSSASEEATRKTMLVDDLFGRWLLSLDGRYISVVIDACYGGGQHGSAKGLNNSGPFAKGLANPGVKSTIRFDFLDGDLQRAKDLGGSKVAMLASSDSNQISFERREGDLSVMTYYLTDKISNADGPVTLRTAFNYLKLEVPKYVRDRFYGASQTPLIEGEGIVDSFTLRP